MMSQAWEKLNLVYPKIVNILTYFKTFQQANLWHAITIHWMGLLSHEWSHLKRMLAVWFEMSNFPPFNLWNSLRKKLFLAQPKRTGKYDMKNWAYRSSISNFGKTISPNIAILILNPGILSNFAIITLDRNRLKNPNFVSFMIYKQSSSFFFWNHFESWNLIKSGNNNNL